MKRGFTLVEVLVAVALSTGVVIAVQTLLVRTLASARAIEHQQTAAAERTAGLDLLADDLAALAVGRELRVAPEGPLSIATLNSLCLNSGHVRHAVRVRYVWEPDHRGGALVRREYDVAEDENSPAAIAVIVARIAAWRVTVWDGQSWSTAWPPATPRPPVAVRVWIKRTSGEESERVIQLAPRAWRTHHD